ncbi:hypothetical protein [Leptospira stimsonii]|nr:hypothetical protein [Leptospira stimsonii]
METDLILLIVFYTLIGTLFGWILFAILAVVVYVSIFGIKRS